MTKRGYIKGSVCDEIVEWLCSNGEPVAIFRGGIRVVVRLKGHIPGGTDRYVDIEFSMLKKGTYGVHYVPYSSVTINPRQWYLTKARRIVSNVLQATDDEFDAKNLWDFLPIAKEDLC